MIKFVFVLAGLAVAVRIRAYSDAALAAESEIQASSEKPPPKTMKVSFFFKLPQDLMRFENLTFEMTLEGPPVPGSTQLIEKNKNMVCTITEPAKIRRMKWLCPSEKLNFSYDCDSYEQMT